MGTDVASLHAVDNSFSEMENTNGWDMGFDDFEGFSGHPEPENPIESHKSPPLLEKSACFERTPTLLSSHRARREVYKMPKEKEHEDTHILLWPIGIMLNLLGFQFKMLGYTMSAAALLLSICFSLLTEPIHRTVEAKNKVTGKISYGISVVTHSRMILWEAASEVGPVLNRLAKRVSYGVLAAAYAFVVVNSLVVPAVLIDYLVVSRLVEEPVHIKESVHFDYTEPRPSARVPLLPQATGITSMTPWSIPKTHSFHITATLTMPESDHNIRLGMFQVTAEILSVNGQVLARFTHPCMLRYQSSPVRYAKTAMFAVPLMLGVDVESQTLVLKLVESYEEKGSSSYPGSAKIILEPRAGFGPGAGLPEIYDARVLVQSKLPPFKAVLYRWKWTCYVWGAVFIFLLEVVLVICCCRHLVFVSPASTKLAEPHAAESESQAPRGEESVIRRPMRKIKRVSFQDDLPRARAAAAGIGTRPSDIDSFVEKELEALSGTKEKLHSVATTRTEPSVPTSALYLSFLVRFVHSKFKTSASTRWIWLATSCEAFPPLHVSSSGSSFRNVTSYTGLGFIKK